MFTFFSNHERNLLLERLYLIDIMPVVMMDGLDYIKGLLVASHNNSGNLLIVDLSQGFDRLSGIPDSYHGVVINEQAFDLNIENNTASVDIFETLSSLDGAVRVTEENLDAFSSQIKSIVSGVVATESNVLTKKRIGQQAFRENLITHWGGECALTGLNDLALLRASHIKPWAKCSSDFERLDVFNGLLLSANLDAAFDVGLISFDTDGTVLYSSMLSPDSIAHLMQGAKQQIDLPLRSKKYMEFHRNNVFKSLQVGVLRTNPREVSPHPSMPY